MRYLCNLLAGVLAHDIDAAHPVRLGLRVSEVDLLGRRELSNDGLRHVVEEEKGHESEAVARSA